MLIDVPQVSVNGQDFTRLGPTLRLLDTYQMYYLPPPFLEVDWESLLRAGGAAQLSAIVLEQGEFGSSPVATESAGAGGARKRLLDAIAELDARLSAARGSAGEALPATQYAREAPPAGLGEDGEQQWQRLAFKLWALDYLAQSPHRREFPAPPELVRCGPVSGGTLVRVPGVGFEGTSELVVKVRLRCVALSGRRKCLTPHPPSPPDSPPPSRPPLPSASSAVREVRQQQVLRHQSGQHRVRQPRLHADRG